MFLESIYAAKLAEHAEKLTTAMASVYDLMKVAEAENSGGNSR